VVRPDDTADLLKLASHYTLARLLGAHDFSQRYSAGIPISMLEMLYPLVQA